MIKITPKVLSIPPYLSTTWKEISSLSFDERRNLLTIVLHSQHPIEIPNLERPAIDAIFEAHARFVESASPALPQPPILTPGTTPFNFSMPFKLEGGLMEPFSAPMHHNPNQAGMPNLPTEFLAKVREILHVFGLDRGEAIPPAEPSCNCPYCQIARFASPDESRETIPEPREDQITEKDLQFRTWDIKQTAEKLYLVSNPLDEREHYSVFLGEPLGCTCGQKNCEHIRAVLNT